MTHPTLIDHLNTAHAALIEARRTALADATNATYRLTDGRISPLIEASAAAARVDDLLHLTARLLKSL
jgi:hypothetical protein